MLYLWTGDFDARHIGEVWASLTGRTVPQDHMVLGGVNQNRVEEKPPGARPPRENFPGEDYFDSDEFEESRLRKRASLTIIEAMWCSLHPQPTRHGSEFDRAISNLADTQALRPDEDEQRCRCRPIFTLSGMSFRPNLQLFYEYLHVVGNNFKSCTASKLGDARLIFNSHVYLFLRTFLQARMASRMTGFLAAVTQVFF